MFPTFRFNFDKYVDIDKHVDVSIHKTVFSAALIIGQVADAEADAQSFAPDSLVETHTFTNITPVGGIAHSESTSATNGAYWYLG